MAVLSIPDVAQSPAYQQYSPSLTQYYTPSSSMGAVETTSRLQVARTEVYNVEGRLSWSDDGGSRLDVYFRMRKEVNIQLEVVQGWYAPEATETKDTDQAGPDLFDGVPEYWNKENTARRIFQIAMMGYSEGMDRGEFADRAIAMVKQAYSDVGAVLGQEFPQLVLETKQAVLDALDQFKGGTTIGEIPFA
jgi:hypothetical protein